MPVYDPQGQHWTNTMLGDVVIGVPASLGATYGYQAGRNISIDITPPPSAFAAAGPINVANEGAGTGLVYDAILNGTYYFRTLQADPTAGNGGIVITTDIVDKVVDIGNSMTGANLGAGQPVFVSKTVPGILQFNSLIAGTNVTITPQGGGGLLINAATQSGLWEYAADTNTLHSSVALSPAFPGAVIPSDLVFPGVSTEASGITLIFDASNGAFRAGQVGGAQWTQANRGANSAAFGLNNTASGQGSFIGAGSGNTLDSSTLTCAIAGGGSNAMTAAVTTSFIGGGANNAVQGPGSLGGGSLLSSIIGGGNGNTALDSYGVIGGGLSNSIALNAPYSGILGGESNNVQDGGHSVIAGGKLNSITDSSRDGAYNTISGGLSNLIESTFAEGSGVNTIAGGQTNVIGASSSNSHAFIGGGQGNTNNGETCVIVGGSGNTISAGAAFATIGGGINNTCTTSGARGTVPGGIGNTVSAVSGIACGDSATCAGANSFCFADGNALTNSTANTAVFGVSNGATFFTNAGHTLGVTVGAGGVAWAAVSDRNKKENAVELPYHEVLSTVERLPIYEYNYKGTPTDVRYRAPYAQDWHAAFPSNKDPLSIDTLDFDGITLAALRGLAQLVRKQELALREQEARLKKLEEERPGGLAT